MKKVKQIRFEVSVEVHSLLKSKAALSDMTLQALCSQLISEYAHGKINMVIKKERGD